MRLAQLLPCVIFVGLLWLISPAQAAPIPEQAKIGGFALGCQAYTFNRFSAFEAIEMTAIAGAKLIEFFPGQKLSPDDPSKWDHNASDETIQKIKAKLDQHHVVAVNYGVVGAKGEAEWRKIFEFAKKLGLYAITTEAITELDLVEKLVKEYDIRLAIHEHARRPNDAEYKLWDPNYVLSLVKNRDSRMGACADTGHWATSGIKPLDALKILEGRIISCHLKDRAEIGKQLPDTIYGTGVSDVSGLLAELKRQGFAGNISIEYENNWDKSVPDVAQCVGFVRGCAAARAEKSAVQ
jgi:sugar phosphate isomerase/epimerase